MIDTKRAKQIEEEENYRIKVHEKHEAKKIAEEWVEKHGNGKNCGVRGTEEINPFVSGYKYEIHWSDNKIHYTEYTVDKWYQYFENFSAAKSANNWQELKPYIIDRLTEYIYKEGLDDYRRREKESIASGKRMQILLIPVAIYYLIIATLIVGFFVAIISSAIR